MASRTLLLAKRVRLRARTVAPSGSRFLHEHVAGELRRRISSGLYLQGRPIPTVAGLVHEFGVSAITVRRALRDLVVEGLLVGRQGLGVFVKDGRRIVRSLSSASPTSFADHMRMVGVEPGFKELGLSIISAPTDIAARLDLPRGTTIYRHDKLILADGRPISLDIAYLSRELGDALRDGLSMQFLFSLLTARDIAFDHIDFRLEGSGASEEQARVFGLPIGFPLVVVHYTPVKADGAPLLTGLIISRSDRLSFDLCMRPETHRPHRHSRCTGE